MADMTCSCFWPNSHNHASQHTDGNTTVSKTHCRLFFKALHMFYNVKNERTCWQLMAVFSFSPSLFVLALESQSESQLHRPHHSISHEKYCTFLLFVFSVRTHRDSCCPYLQVSHSGALCCCGFNWQLCGIELDCFCALLFPCHFVSYSFLFHSTY